MRVEESTGLPLSTERGREHTFSPLWVKVGMWVEEKVPS